VDPRAALRAIFPSWTDAQIDGMIAAQGAPVNPQ
jgi:hypothetical protein